MNTVEVELDYHQIAQEIFTKNNIDNNYQLDNLDIKTFFELLILVLIDGIKIVYNTDKIDLSKLNNKEVEIINTYLKKLGIKCSIKIYNLISWKYLNGESSIKDYRKYDITNKTELKELNYIITHDNYYYVIQFDFLN